MSIYTKTGDRGKTSLFSGERIAKSDRRIAVYGDVDELNSVLGLLRAHLPEEAEAARSALLEIQTCLFVVGSWLAVTPGSPLTSELQAIAPSDVEFLETAIDRMSAELPPLRQFILPGGHVTAGWAHLARTVCRRTERRAVSLLGDDESETATPQQMVLVYLNRLSDYLFVLARYCNLRSGTEETLLSSE